MRGRVGAAVFEGRRGGDCVSIYVRGGSKLCYMLVETFFNQSTRDEGSIWCEILTVRKQ